MLKHLTVHSLDNVFEEGEGEEMIGHVAGVKHEVTFVAALLSCCYCDFAVLYYLVLTVYLTDHAHCLGRVSLLHHLPMRKHCQNIKAQSRINGRVS